DPGVAAGRPTPSVALRWYRVHSRRQVSRSVRPADRGDCDIPDSAAPPFATRPRAALVDIRSPQSPARWGGVLRAPVLDSVSLAALARGSTTSGIARVFALPPDNRAAG